MPILTCTMTARDIVAWNPGVSKSLFRLGTQGECAQVSFIWKVTST